MLPCWCFRLLATRTTTCCTRLQTCSGNCLVRLISTRLYNTILQYSTCSFSTRELYRYVHCLAPEHARYRMLHVISKRASICPIHKIFGTTTHKRRQTTVAEARSTTSKFSNGVGSHRLARTRPSIATTNLVCRTTSLALGSLLARVLSSTVQPYSSFPPRQPAGLGLLVWHVVS